jgi:hypothetical protein
MACLFGGPLWRRSPRPRVPRASTTHAARSEPAVPHTALDRYVEAVLWPRRARGVIFHASALADASGSVCVATASYSASAGSTVKEPPWSGLTVRNARSSSVRIRRVPQRLARTTSDASAKPSSRSW